MLGYGAAALVLIAAAIYAVSPFATLSLEQWSRRDVELRATLVFNSVREELVNLLEKADGARIDALFERLAQDERLLAVGFCDGQGNLQHSSRMMPPGFSCQQVARSSGYGFSAIMSGGRRLLAGSFPLGSEASSGHLVLLHDLTYAAQRRAQARLWVIAALALVALAGAAIVAVIALLVVRRWMRSVERAIEDARAGRTEAVDDPIFGHEIRHLLRDFNEARRSVDAVQIDWNPETLRALVGQHLSDAEIFVVSNREPYIHNRTGDQITLQIPASGLVAAVEPVMQACGGTWIAHGSGDADHEVVDAQGRVGVPPAAPSYTLRRIWLTEEEQDGYYYGFSNEGLWPLCHVAFVRPAFRDSDWQQYRAVNARFAQAVVEEATRPDPIILVQDYHLALLPKLIRERLPQATIVTFWHIPWPNAEVFGICPWKEEIVEGLLGSSVLGFHTQFHCNNFIDTVDRFIESRIDREHASVTVRDHETFVRPYPISIAWPPVALAGQKPVRECRDAVRKRLGLDADMRLGVGIERFDYTKGILDRMRAVDSFLTRYPDHRGRFVFVQVAAPTRDKLASYRALQDEAAALADEINRRHGSETYKPMMLVVRHHEPDEVFELFRAADLCVVSSLHDGMNLVAKEFVAARDDERGVLILSSFAGASRELSEALIVNPYDARATGRAIAQALSMSDNEQGERMRLMREVVRERNVYRWAGRMLLEAAQLRKRQRIMQMISRERRKSAPFGRRSHEGRAP